MADWDDAAVFRLVAEEASVAGAARRLRVSTAAVSQRIARLERRVGVALLHRGSRGVRLTEAGEALLTGVNAMAAAWTHALARLAPAPGDAPPLRFALAWLSQTTLFERLHTALPGTSWRFHALDGGADGPAALAAGGLDLLLQFDLTGAEPPDTTLARATVVREPLWVYLPPGHPAGGEPLVDLRDLAGAEWIASAQPGLREALVRVCESVGGFTPRIAHRTDDSEMTYRLIRDGMGVTLGSPVARAAAEVDRRAFRDAPVQRIALWWAPTVPDATAEAVLAVVRACYADRVRAVPAYREWVRRHPTDFPGIRADGPG